MVGGFLASLFIGFFVQCLPYALRFLWEDPMKCNRSARGAQISGIVNIFIDITILISPLPMVWGLQMSKKQKIAVSGVFMLGLM